MAQQQDNGIYYFLGNITSHILHALPLYRELGGTFVVLSERAKREVEKYGVPVIAIDNRPYVWQRFGWRVKPVYHYLRIDSGLKRTTDFLNSHASVVLFYELYDFDELVQLRTSRTVFLTHGNMLKDYMGQNNRLRVLGQYDYMASLGPRLKDVFIKKYGISTSKLVDLGIARTDELAASRGQVVIVPSLVDETNVDPAKKIAVYLPTFWGASSVYDSGLELVKNFPENYTLFFRPHPQTPKKLLRKYLRIIADKPNVVFAPEGAYRSATLPNIFAASSVVIGDLSSVMLEAVLVEKPLIFMPLADQDTSSDYDGIREIVAFSETFNPSYKDFAPIIDRAIEKGIDPGIWKAAQRYNFFNFEGDSTKKIAAFISKLI